MATLIVGWTGLWTFACGTKDATDFSGADAAWIASGGVFSAGGTSAGGVSGAGGVAGTTAVVLAGGGGNGGNGGASATVSGAGGITTTGGSIGTGGVTGVAGSSGAGGVKGSGGVVAAGGAAMGAGGVNASGGKIGAGGIPASGGGGPTGGSKGAGGVTGAGGLSASGGVVSTGGTTATSTLPTGAPGNPDGHCTVPADAQLEDVSSRTTVVGTGTPASCTPDAFVAAVAKGGVTTFNCGPDPVTITLTSPAKVFNDKGPKIVIDGGGKVTLSGGGTTRILYMNTCDQMQVWTTSHCDNQDSPQLTVQNLTFTNGNAKNETEGGGAIFASGGRLKVINSRFTKNVCADTGQDIGGGAIRAFQQYNGLPLYVVASTFGGADGLGNSGSNGGALSSIGVSWTVLNSVLGYNHAVGNGGNPAQSGTPGGGSGGAIYNDGNKMTLTICGTIVQYNQVNAYGSAVFFVSNNHSGNMAIDSSTITNNIGGSWYPTYPQISCFDDTPIAVANSTIQ
jgi:hypothetical protein